MFSIILVRLPMWLTAITLFKDTKYTFISLFCMIIFILLDIYWLKVIYKNMNDKRGINYIKKNKSSSEIFDKKNNNKSSTIEDITCSTISETANNSKSLFKLSNNNVTSNSFYIKKKYL
jgi:uncharacterized protein YxeA